MHAINRRTAFLIVTSFVVTTAVLVSLLTAAPNASAKRVGVSGELYAETTHSWSFWGGDATCNHTCATTNNHALPSFNTSTRKTLDPTRQFAAFQYKVDHSTVDEILIRAKGTRCNAIGPKMKVHVGLIGSNVQTSRAYITKEAPRAYPDWDRDTWSTTDRVYSAALRDAAGNRVSYKLGQTLMVKVTFSNPAKFDRGTNNTCDVWEWDNAGGKYIGQRKLYVDWVAMRGPEERDGLAANPYW